MESSADSDSGPGTKLNIVAGKSESLDVTSGSPFNGWEPFCEFLRNCQPPRSLSECTADDAVEFLSRLPSNQIEAVVGSLSAATFQEIGGNNKENPFCSSIIRRTFLKELLEEKGREKEYGNKLQIEVGNPIVPATSAQTQELVEKHEDVKTPLKLPVPEHSIPMVEPVFVITCDKNQDPEETYFISYIFNELCLRGFTPFRCDLTRSTVAGNLEMLCRSRVGIIIVSRNYVRSWYCLDEFVARMDHLKANDIVVLPVFFKVSLSDITDQRGYFARAFLRLVEKKKVQAYIVKKWKAAMIELAAVNSYLYMKGDEVKLAKNIVRDVCLLLNSETNRNVNGIRVILKSILPLLHCPQSTGPHIVGLWGMAGIGKTTIMREIFRTQAERYDVSYFLPDFHIMSETKGLSRLRDEFFSKIFGEEKNFINVCDTKLSFIRDRFLDKRVLIVLDGVSNVGDVEVLVGGFGWFSSGHTIILSSRNRQILVQCKAKGVHKISKLSESESFRIFYQYATEQNWKGRLISELLNYASGIPLALRLLGLSLQKQRISNGKEHLRRLRQHPPVEIQDAFKRSFNGLDDNEKNIFLDLACFFRGEFRDHVVKVLDGCGLFTDLGICGLFDESLISIVDNKIDMPNIFQDMGRFVVCQENEEAGKRSRLWESNDIADILTNNLGTEAIEGIFLDASGLAFELSPTVFERMYRLRLLKLRCPSSENVLLPQGLYCLPDELRLLHWERYPLGSLPRNFNPKHLVELKMPYSNMTKLWKGTKNLEKLKRIILSHSQQLAKFPRLSKARNLEHIDLEGCTSLVKVNSSIHHLHKLTFLSLKDCCHLRIMPTTVHLESLEVLNLSGCSELEEVQGFSPNLKELYLAETAIKEIPSSILDLTRLTTLDLENCERLQHLPPGVSDLKALVTIKLSGCSNLESLSILYALYLRDLQHLNPKITMDRSVFLKLHSATQEPRLEGSETLLNSDNLQFRSDILGLRLSGEAVQEFLPVFGYPSSDRITQANWPWNTITPLPSSILHSLASKLYALVSLFLCNTCLVDLPEEICWLPSVKALDLGGNSFSQIPESIKEFRKLQTLRLRHCKNLRSLPELPKSLEILNAHGCVSLEAFPSSLGQSLHYTFTNCFSLSPEVVKKYIVNAFESFEGMAKGHLQEHRKAPAFSICMPTSACRQSSIYFQVGSKARIERMRKTPAGFVLSVVVEFWENYRNAVGFGIKCICKWKTNQGLSLGLEKTYQFWAPKEAPIVQKDHMFVFGFVKFHPNTAEGHDLDILNGLMTFEFHPVNLQKKLLDDSCTVKKCGVHLIRTATCDKTLSTKRLASSMDPGELSGLEHMTPPYKRCRFKRVIESVILSLRKRKREKSVSRIIKQRIINRSKLGSVNLAQIDQSLRKLEQNEEKKSLRFYPSSVWPVNALPERPGTPECAFYMKTGVCNFGNFCKFHHPRDRVSDDLPLRPDQFGSVIPSIFDHNSKKLKQKEEAEGQLLKLVGTTVKPRNVLPERPDQPNCIYYMRTGDCKFGNTCKFNHPKIKPESSLSLKDLSLKTAQTYAQRIDRYFMTPKAPHLYPPSSKLADTSDEKLGRFSMQTTSSGDVIDAEQEEEECVYTIRYQVPRERA